MYFPGHPFAKIIYIQQCRLYILCASCLRFALITSCPPYRRGGDMINAVSAYSEIPSSIRVVEAGYGDARLSWFFSVPPDSFGMTSSAVLDLSVYSEIPSSIRGVEAGYGDARLSWFFSVPPDSFGMTSSAVLDLSVYSEIPSSIRGMEDSYGDARLSWFSSLTPNSFVTTSSAVLDLCLRIQGSRVRFASRKTVMVTQDCCGFPQYLWAALLRRHQLVWIFSFNTFSYTQCV